MTFSESRSPVWHPFTQHALEPEMERIVKTDGSYLISEKGHSIFDAISSWWVITHGHRHPAIMAAIQAACEAFDQIIFAEYTHEPAEVLAKGLIELALPGLTHVFYSDSGSTAVEVALKMALGFFYHMGVPRSRVVVMEGGYHGDTVGAMSVGARSVFNTVYEPLLFEVDRIPFPVTGCEQATLDAFEQHCNSRRVAALLIEPLVLGAGGMRMYSPNLLTELARVARAHQTLLIADEVMTGWGRTGTLFACEQACVTPDLLCLSKGLTAGALPLSVTLCSAPIFDAHRSADRARTFFHSSSYTANPLACAAGLANLAVWRKEPVVERIKGLEQMHRERLEPFRSDFRFTQVRQMGTIAALDLSIPTTGYLCEVGPKLRAFFRSRDMLIRPLGNVIYLMPPYCATASDLNAAYAAIDEAADVVGAGRR